MSVVTNLVLVLHLLGMAAILGGWVATRTSPRVHPAVVWGARAQLVTGLALVGLVEAANDPSDPPNHPKIGVKLLVALVHREREDLLVDAAGVGVEGLPGLLAVGQRLGVTYAAPFEVFPMGWGE